MISSSTITRDMGIVAERHTVETFLGICELFITMLVHYSQQRVSILRVNPVPIHSFLSCVVGSVPTCAVASELFLEQYRSCTPGATIEQPLAGVILHAGLHSGKTYPCGCLIQCCDPLNNAQRVSEIEVCDWNSSSSSSS